MGEIRTTVLFRKQKMLTGLFGSNKKTKGQKILGRKEAIEMF